MKKCTLLLLFMLISINTSLFAKIIRMQSKTDLLHNLVGNELYTEKESIKFLQNHTLVYTNLLTNKRTIGMWAVKDSEMSIRGGTTPAICFTVEKGEGTYKNDPSTYAGGICMDLWEIPDPEPYYMVGYKTWLVMTSKNNPKYTEFPEQRFTYPQDTEFSKQYFKLRKNRFSAGVSPSEEKKYLYLNHEKYLAKIIKYAKDIPKGFTYLKKNNLNFKDYSNYFITRDYGKNVTRYNFFNSPEYKYLQHKYPHTNPKISAEGSIYGFNINIQYTHTSFGFKFNFPVVCTSRNVTGGVQKTCRPSKNDMSTIKRFQKYYNKLGFAKEFASALKKSQSTRFIAKTYNRTVSSGSSSGSKTFSCTYSCISDVGLFYETYRNVGSIKISANSYSYAKDKAYDIMRKRCKNTLDKHGYKMRAGSTDCDFGQ